MEIEIIDKNNEWFLGKVCLWDYLNSLDIEDFNYSVQRGIVNNPYLDSILDSVNSNSAIPPISLVTNQVSLNDNIGRLDSFDILDGLQRTYRLWVYMQIAKQSEELHDYNYKSVSAKVREIATDYSRAVSPKQVRSLFVNNPENITVWNLREKYSRYFIYLYVWAGLSSSEIVKKMLILNAGQKRMALSHQYELMYLRLFKDYQNLNPDVSLYRNKDSRFNDVKVGNRNIGEYNIPSVIIGMESFVKGEPVRLSADLLYDKMNNSNFDDDGFISQSSVNLFFNTSFISSFIDILLAVDRKISNSTPYKKWFAKDTTVSGVMAGVGCHVRRLQPDDYGFAENSVKIAIMLISRIRETDPFNIDEFESEYNKLSSVRINIGNIVRKAIAQYTKQMLEEGTADWGKIFDDLTSKKSND